jgi:hypothetical protein
MWSAEEWTAFAGALTLVIGALAAAAVAIIKALRGVGETVAQELADHESNSQIRSQVTLEMLDARKEPTI